MLINKPARRRGARVSGTYSNVTRLSASVEIPASKTTDEMEEMLFLQFSDATMSLLAEKYFRVKEVDYTEVRIAREELRIGTGIGS